MKKNLKVLLLAGGKSERFWPLVDKPLINLLGRTLLEQQINLLNSVGLHDVVVVGSESVIKQIPGQKIKTVLQKGEGQSSAIVSAKNEIAHQPVLILNVADLVDENLLKKW